MVRIVGRGISRRWLVGPVLGSVVGLLATGLLAPAVLAADHPVDIAGFAFSPQTITIKVGDSVTWANADAQSHTATADDGSWQTGTIGGNTSKSLTFSTAGTFAYHCSIHRQMTATLVVTSAAPATDTAPDTADADGVASGPGLLLVLLGGLVGLVLGGRRFVGRPDRP